VQDDEGFVNKNKEPIHGNWWVMKELR